MSKTPLIDNNVGLLTVMWTNMGYEPLLFGLDQRYSLQKKMPSIHPKRSDGACSGIKKQLQPITYTLGKPTTWGNLKHETKAWKQTVPR